MSLEFEREKPDEEESRAARARAYALVNRHSPPY